MKNFKLSNIPRWHFYSFSLVALFSFLLSFKWSLTPTFIDIYYHLSAVLGFDEAGGFVATAFWEAAPFGRPHLYPPFTHFLMLFLFKIGMPILSVARLFEYCMFPILLITMWYFIKSFCSDRAAFFSVLIASSAYSFYLSSVNFIPTSVAIVLGLLAFLCLEKDKIIAAAILLGLCFYAHVGVPWIFLGSFCVYGLFNSLRLKSCLKVAGFGLLLALPILVFQYNLREYLSIRQNIESFILEINLWIYLAAIPGIFIAIKRRGSYLFIPSFLIFSMMPLIIGYYYRTLSGQGIIAFIFLSAISLDSIFARMSKSLISYFKNKNERCLKHLLLLFIFVFFFVFSPSIVIQNDEKKLCFVNSTYVNLVPEFKTLYRPNEFSIYFPKFFKDISDIVGKYSQEGDIIYCNQDYVGGLISVLTRRATSNVMLQEIRTNNLADPAKDAKIIIWMKDPDRKIDLEMLSFLDRYDLNIIVETDLAYIYLNDHTRAKRIVAEPKISSSLVFVILFLLFSICLFDIFRKRKS